MTLTSAFFLLGVVLLLGSIVLVAADPTGGGTLTWLGMGALVAGPLAWGGMALVPRHRASVPHTLIVDDNRWTEVADLTPVPEHPEYFRTKAGTLLTIDRGLSCTARTARQLPEQARAEAKRMEAAAQAAALAHRARCLIEGDRLDAARQLVDGQVDEWRLA
jgi:hypothetical protein